MVNGQKSVDTLSRLKAEKQINTCTWQNYQASVVSILKSFT